jgi:FkbM family methyltransferase
MNKFELLDYDKQDIFLSISSETEKNIRLTSCRREPKTVDWIENLPDGSVFFDIGANVGSYSLIAASQNKIGRHISVYSFEPHFANYYSLVNNIRYNKLEEFIIPINIAVSNINQSAKLYHWDKYLPGEAGSSGHQLNREIDYEGNAFKAEGMQSILSVSIDSFCRNYEIYPTAIKIDVDGIEELIVKGMANLILQDDRLKSILIELNLDCSKFITPFLINSGFSVVEHNINGNVLFVRK